MRQLPLIDGDGYLSRLHDLLEFSKRLLNLTSRSLAEQRRQSRPQFPGRRIVLKRDTYYGAASAGCAFETHVSCIVDVRSLERTPTDHFVFTIDHDLRIPLELPAARHLQGPVGQGPVDHINCKDILEQPRKVLQISPIRIEILRRPADRDGLLQLDSISVRPRPDA